MASEQSLRLLVADMPGLIITATAAGATEWVSTQALEYLGKTLDALKGWAVSDAVHPEDRAEAVSAWGQSLETGNPYDIQHRLRGGNGTYRWFHVRGVPARDAEGRIIRWNILLTDIDDRKHAEEKLRRCEADLIVRGRLADNLQHEREGLRLLLDLNNRVASDLDLREVFQAISSEPRRIFQCDFVGLALPDSTGKHMRRTCSTFRTARV